MKTTIVFIAAFLAGLGLTILVTQYVNASNAIGAPGGNLTAQTNVTAIPYPGNDSMIAQNVSRVNVTLLGTNAILNLDPATFTGSIQVIGEVFNNGTQNINSTNFFIPATLYDVNGTIVGTFSTVPELAVIDANNSSPFKVTFFDADVKNGVLGALFYKVQADNKSVFGVLPPPPPMGVGLGVPLGPPVPSGVPFGFPPLGPMMGAPIFPAPGFPITPSPIKPGCDPSYPDFCIPSPPPDLNCFGRVNGTLLANFTVRPPDPHRFDGEAGPNEPDGRGCEGTPPALNKTTTVTNATNATETQPIAIEGPDDSCLFDTQQPKCAAVNGECPTEFNKNEDDNCFPQHERCPSGYHSEEDNESGECYPDSRPCPDGYVMDPDFPTCAKMTVEFCEEHKDITECKEFLDKQIALTSNATNSTTPNDGEEQEEENQGQGQGQETTAGPASVQSNQAGQSVTVEEQPQEEEEEEEKDNEDED